jgi:hypothetical protein
VKDPSKISSDEGGSSRVWMVLLDFFQLCSISVLFASHFRIHLLPFQVLNKLAVDHLFMQIGIKRLIASLTAGELEIERSMTEG